MFNIDTLDELPDAPFFLAHNGVYTYGGLVQETDAGFTVWNGERTLEVDQTYEVSTVGSRLVFTSRDLRSTLSFRPLKLSDKKLLIDGGASIQSLEQLVDVINEMFSSAE